MNQTNDNFTTTILTLTAIFYITVLYILFGIYVVTLLDEYGINSILIDKNDTKDSIFRLVLELAITVATTACIAYVGKYLIQLIPFPFDGWYGFDYKSVREVNTGHILFIFMFTFSAIISNKMEVLKKKLNNIKSVPFSPEISSV